MSLPSRTYPEQLPASRISGNGPLVEDFFCCCKERQSDVPPPYVDAPRYTRRAPEPITLAMYLFKFGFLFPPFWILGIAILVSPLRAPAVDIESPYVWLPEKTDAERQMIIDRLRVIELKWGWRCLYALLGLIVVVVGAVIVELLVRRGRT